MTLCILFRFVRDFNYQNEFSNNSEAVQRFCEREFDFVGLFVRFSKSLATSLLSFSSKQQ